MRNIRYFKLNEDDILEIVGEFVAKKTRIKEFTTKSLALGTPGKDLRILVAVSNNSLADIDLFDIDKKIGFNGDHSFANGLNDEEMLNALDKMIMTGDF